jgi:hypothetical protein
LYVVLKCKRILIGKQKITLAGEHFAGVSDVVLKLYVLRTVSVSDQCRLCTARGLWWLMSFMVDLFFNYPATGNTVSV